MDFDRRGFLRQSAALASAALLASSHAREAKAEMTDQSDAVPVIDTHLHCFAGPDDARFPYHARGPYQPDAPATPEHLLQCMDAADVDFAVVVHPEPYQDDHRYLEHCLEVGGNRLKGTSLFFADRPDSLAAMPGFLKRNVGRVVATRLHAYAPERLPPWGSKELRKMWALAAEAGVAMQVHLEPRYAPLVEPYLDEFRETLVIIDHCGRPFQGTPEEHRRILRWSEQPNTVIKLSSLPRLDQYPHRDIGPVVRELVAAFGAERSIYGGGFGAEATGASYRAYRERLAGYLEGLNPGELAAVLGGTARRVFWGSNEIKN